jgi:hypothetical protein
MSKRRRWLLIGALFIIAIQFLQPDRSQPVPDQRRSLQAHLEVPPDIESILRRACYNCHSYETDWPWYSRVVPFAWVVGDDVHRGRFDMNFSDWARHDSEEAALRLHESCQLAGEGHMPPGRYRRLHPASRLTRNEIDRLCEWSHQQRLKLLEKQNMETKQGKDDLSVQPPAE